MRGIRPAVGRPLFLGEFVQAREEADTLHLHRNRILLRLHLQRLLQVLLDVFFCGLLLQVHLPLREMGLNLLQVGIDPLGGDFLGILIALRLHLVSIPVIRIDGVANRGLKGNTLHRQLDADCLLLGTLTFAIFEVYCNWHNQSKFKIYA